MPYPDIGKLSPYRLEEIEDLLCQMKEQPVPAHVDKGAIVTLTRVEFARLVLTAFKGASTADKKPVR